MSNGSKKCGCSAPKIVGYISHVPVKTAVRFEAGKRGGGGSRISGNSAPKTVATIGYVSHGPVKTTVRFEGRKGGVGGSRNSGNSAPKTVATVGYISHAPVKTTVSFKGANGGRGGEGSFETKSRITNVDKQTGCYRRTTTKEKASAAEFHGKNGTSGVKSEYKKSSAVRVGDKGGYTEVYNEQRVRHVSYNKSSGSKNLITYNHVHY